MKRKYFFNYFITIIMFVLIILLSTIVSEKKILILSIIPSISTIIYIFKICKNYSNIYLIFVIFTILYGLAGPIAVYFGEGIGSIYGTLYEIKKYIVAYSLSEIGIIIGSTALTKIDNDYEKKQNIHLKEFIIKNKNVFLNFSLIFMFVGVLFQLINTFRCGGFTVLLNSKAYYQAKESTLFLTLPANEVILIAFTFLSIYIGAVNDKKGISCMKIIIELIIFIPYLVIVCLLGQRGKLLSIIVILFLGFYYFKPLKKIGIKLILIILMAYFFLCFLYANRAIVGLLKNDPQLFLEKAFSSERIVAALNPGVNEFGCAYGNFNKFITIGNYEFKYGETYIKGLVLPIPSFLYPGKKPQQITYVFRDTYFASEAKRSSIAGTGFSAILEAYWNFGYIGVLIMYYIYSLIISIIERKKYKISIINPIIYIYFSSILILFSRTAFGDIFATIAIKSIILILFFVIPYLLKINEREKNYDKKNINNIIK